MKRLNFKSTDILAAAAGAAIGAAVGSVPHLPFAKDNTWFVPAIIGGVVGLLALPVYRWVTGGRELVVENLEITLFGSKVKVGFTEAHRMLGWRIFVEASTRIATQRLKDNEGSLREALSSLYKLFDIIRGELKTQLPSAPPEQPGAYTIESYGLRMLNDALRPMLSRWHPRLATWEKTGGGESQWELAGLCRRDLETTRQKVLVYVCGLGEILKVNDLNTILQLSGEDVGRDTSGLLLISDEEIDKLLEEKKGEETVPEIDETHRNAGWHIFVELASRVATQPVTGNAGDIREAMSSLFSLYDLIRTEVKQLTPARPDPDRPETVEKIALDILNGPLRGFLTKWHPLLTKYEKEDGAKAEWDQAASCRAELEELRQHLVAEAEKLGRAIDISAGDYLAGSPS
jgi:hypothetical protein